MPENSTPKGDYEVGYGKPPKHTQFVPGQSGNANRRKKKPPETAEKIIERILQEVVEVGGQKMTKLELAIHSCLSRAIKAGNMRDLEKLLDMLDKHGIKAKMDWAAEQQQAADETMQKIGRIMARNMNRDPADLAAMLRHNQEEANIVMECSHCGPILRARWKNPEYKALSKRSEQQSDFHSEVTDRERKSRLIRNWESLPRDSR